MSDSDERLKQVVSMPNARGLSRRLKRELSQRANDDKSQASRHMAKNGEWRHEAIALRDETSPLVGKKPQCNGDI